MNFEIGQKVTYYTGMRIAQLKVIDIRENELQVESYYSDDNDAEYNGQWIPMESVKHKKNASISKSKAKQNIYELLETISTINSVNDKFKYPFRVKKLILFGLNVIYDLQIMSHYIMRKNLVYLFCYFIFLNLR